MPRPWYSRSVATRSGIPTSTSSPPIDMRWKLIATVADDLPVLLPEQHRRRPHRVALVEPLELGLRGPLAPDARHQVRHVAATVAVVLDDPHLVDVPSAWLNRRRACVPATVSLRAIRSHAPASTSSNVRDGYGSTL